MEVWGKRSEQCDAKRHATHSVINKYDTIERKTNIRNNLVPRWIRSRGRPEDAPKHN